MFDLFRSSRFIRLFDPHSGGWIRHQNFALAASCFSLAQTLGDDADIRDAGSEYAVEVFRLFVHCGFKPGPRSQSEPNQPQQPSQDERRG